MQKTVTCFICWRVQRLMKEIMILRGITKYKIACITKMLTFIVAYSLGKI